MDLTNFANGDVLSENNVTLVKNSFIVN